MSWLNSLISDIFSGGDNRGSGSRYTPGVGGMTYGGWSPSAMSSMRPGVDYPSSFSNQSMFAGHPNQQTGQQRWMTQQRPMASPMDLGGSPLDLLLSSYMNGKGMPTGQKIPGVAGNTNRMRGGLRNTNMMPRGLRNTNMMPNRY